MEKEDLKRDAKQLKRNPLFIFGCGIIFLIFFLAVLAPFISPHDPNKMYRKLEFDPPSSEHWLGTDGLGRDLFSRIIWGARTSLMVGIIGVLVSSVIGIIMGAITGYYSGAIDNILMRVCDIIMTLPLFFLLIVIASILATRNIVLIAVVIGLTDWPTMARIVRSEFLFLKEITFVEAARGIGATDARIIFRHILPNAIAPIIVTSTLKMAQYILYESALSFLGLGDLTAISWGYTLSQGQKFLTTAWWIATFPGIMIFFTTLGLNLMGDGLRDVLDVRQRIG